MARALAVRPPQPIFVCKDGNLSSQTDPQFDVYGNAIPEVAIHPVLYEFVHGELAQVAARFGACVGFQRSFTDKHPNRDYVGCGPIGSKPGKMLFWIDEHFFEKKDGTAELNLSLAQKNQMGLKFKEIQKQISDVKSFGFSV